MDIIYDDKLKKSQRSIHSFQNRLKHTFNSLQTIKMKTKQGYKTNEKLMLKLTDEEDYVNHGEMFDWYLEHGLK